MAGAEEASKRNLYLFLHVRSHSRRGHIPTPAYRSDVVLYLNSTGEACMLCKAHPWPTIILTFCSLKSSLSTMASQMGASHKLDLTSDVTHLLVGDVDTPKYKYVARERPDVKCLHHEWVEAVRASWIEGGETDVEALEKEYRLPTFYGLRICVTGFSDSECMILVVLMWDSQSITVTQRKQLEASINDNGAEYLGDLSKDVTHLVAASATGEKYQFAKHWGVKIVAIEWLEQSLDRGMVLEETLYDPQLEVNKRGIGAVAPRPATLRLPTKRRSDNVPEQQLPRKLRRTASAKLNNETAIIWTDIVRAGSGPEGAKQTEWEDSFAENKSINPESSTLLVGLPLADPVQKLHLKDGIFSGKSFYLYGFDDDKVCPLPNTD